MPGTEQINEEKRKNEENTKKLKQLESNIEEQTNEIRDKNIGIGKKIQEIDLFFEETNKYLFDLKNKCLNARQSIEDYYKVNKDADNYLLEHRDEFVVDGVYDESKFIDYKLDKMSKNTDKVKFTIYFNLSKDKNGNWSLDEVSEVDEDKILGIYQY